MRFLNILLQTMSNTTVIQSAYVGCNFELVEPVRTKTHMINHRVSSYHNALTYAPSVVSSAWAK